MYLDHAHVYSADLRDLACRVSEDPSNAAREEELNAAFLEALTDLPFGEPFTFVEQYRGELVHDVRPSAGHEAERSSRGRVALDIHTDDSFLDPSARPEHMALLGVSNPGQVPTYLLPIDNVLDRLDEETLAALSEPCFIFGCPASFEIDGHSSDLVPARPILRVGLSGRIEVSFGTRTTVAVGAGVRAERSLAVFRAAIAQAPCLSFALAAGEILLLSNSRCLHGRPPFDGERWIKRVYLRKDLKVLNRVAATGSPGIYVARQAIAVV